MPKNRNFRGVFGVRPGTRLDETCPYVQELPPLHELPYLNDINPITFERQGYDALPTGMNWTQREDGKYVYRKTTTQVTTKACLRVPTRVNE